MVRADSETGEEVPYEKIFKLFFGGPGCVRGRRRSCGNDPPTRKPRQLKTHMPLKAFWNKFVRAGDCRIDRWTVPGFARTRCRPGTTRRLEGHFFARKALTRAETTAFVALAELTPRQKQALSGD